jgi:hypothetical protein
MRVGAIVLAAGAIFLCQQAEAAPQLSGKYVFGMSTNCQETTGEAGKLEEDAGYAVFNSVAKTVTFTGYAVWGTFDKNPTAMHQQAAQRSGAYSNTNSVLKFAGKNFPIFYARVDGGIATYAVFVGVGDSHPGCAERGTLMRVEAVN